MRGMGRRRSVTRYRHSGNWHLFHVLMCFCTGGLWLPVYLAKYARTAGRRTVTTYHR